MSTVSETGREIALRKSDSETGLYYYRARYYDQTVGRFLREDPITLRIGFNRYTYVFDNPIQFTDPAGMWPWSNLISAKQLEDQTAVDQRIYDMTSKYATDPFLIKGCDSGVQLLEINKLAYQNLMIDALLQGGMAIGLLAQHPEYIGKSEDQLKEIFGKLRDQNNRVIDSKVGQAAREACRCTHVARF
jgi:RHS repeat-associated protein